MPQHLGKPQFIPPSDDSLQYVRHRQFLKQSEEPPSDVQRLQVNGGDYNGQPPIIGKTGVLKKMSNISLRY